MAILQLSILRNIQEAFVKPKKLGKIFCGNECSFILQARGVGGGTTIGHRHEITILPPETRHK